MKRTSGSVALGSIVLLIASILCSVVFAQSGAPYPSKPIRFLVPFAPGGVGDLTARVIAHKMSENMGQQVVVDNRPSAGMIVSADMTLKAEPDGYTMVLSGNGTAVSVSLFKALPYDPLVDFAQVSTLAFFDLLLVTGPNSKFNSMADVLVFARSNPGKLDIGTVSIGSTQNLSAELFRSMAGIDAQIIPFKATPALLNAMRANDVHLVFEFIGPLMPQIKNNTVKPLAISSNRRSAMFPDVPTLDESGVPGFQVASWNAVSVHAKTPRAIVERLSKEVAAATNSPDVKEKLQLLGMDARAMTPEQTHKLMAAEITKWKSVIERAKIPLQ
ncbi:MAG: Bug family tripartite tricarboxylate transporter substrate binding protein [Burkholderiales bacterium]